MYLRGIDQGDKLFLKVLTITLSLYIILLLFFLRRKTNITIYHPPTKISKRLTKLIINLPTYKKKESIAPERVKIKKKEVKKDKELKKNRIKKDQPAAKNKKQTKRVKQKSRPAPVSPVKKEKVSSAIKKNIDLNKIGLLNMIDSMSDVSEKIDILENSAVLTVEEGYASILNDTLTSNDSILSLIDEDNSATDHVEEALTKLNEKYETDDTLKIDIQRTKEKKKSNTHKYEDIGERDISEIESMVSEYIDGMKFCYDKSLKKKEEISGKIVVRFTILSSGKTTKISITSDEIRDFHLNDCIIELIKRWKFPSAKTEKLVVTYPLYFVKDS